MLFFLRFLGATFLLIAVIAGVWDGTRSMAGNEIVLTSLRDHWAHLAPGLLAAAQGAVPPTVWSLGIAQVLQAPAWAVLGVLGLLLAYAGRRRRHVNVFAN